MLAQAKWLNLFQYCKFLKLLGHVMVLVVLSFVGFTYYAVVPVTYGPVLFRGSILASLGAALVILVFTALVVMLLWSYFAAVAQDPGKVPVGWHPFADEQQARLELDRMSYSDYYFDRRDPRRPRYCKRCQAWKPERTHHCSVLGRCVLKMDHYCIWVVNCVGLLNYKYFLLFLGYTCVSALFATLVMIRPMVSFLMTNTGTPLAFLVVVADGAFSVSLLAFLIMHGQLVAANCTTIEMYEKDRVHPWPYNKGLRRNMEEVFGRQRWRWLLPMHSKDDKRIQVEQWLNPRLLSMPFLSSPV